MSRLTLDEFCEVVARAIDTVPPPFRAHLDNVVVDVEDRASRRVLEEQGLAADEWDELLGLFDGRALTEQEFGERHPNRITLFQRAFERSCDSRAEIEYEVRRTIVHELAHHFGYSEDDLEVFESMPSPFDDDDFEQDAASPEGKT